MKEKKEKIWIMIIGLLLLTGTLAAVPINASPATDNTVSVDKTIYISTMEDCPYYLNLTPIFGDGWTDMKISSTEHLNVEVAGNEAVIGMEPDWNGRESFQMTATYYSTNPPPSNSIESVSRYTLQVNMYVRPVNDPPYVKEAIKTPISFDEDKVLTANLYDYFGDVDNDVLQFSATSNTPEVSVSISDNGTITLTPQHNWYGGFKLAVSASDGEYTTEATDRRKGLEREVYIPAIDFLHS